MYIGCITAGFAKKAYKMALWCVCLIQAKLVRKKITKIFEKNSKN